MSPPNPGLIFRFNMGKPAAVASSSLLRPTMAIIIINAGKK